MSSFQESEFVHQTGSDSWPWRHLLARALILWDGRKGRLTAGELRGGSLAEDLFRFLLRIAPRDMRGLSRTDADAALHRFLDEYTDLVGWYKALLRPPEIQIEWRDRQPFIAPGCVTEWERLANYFDTDVLLTYHLADHLDRPDLNREIADPLAALSDWRTVARISDHELSVLCRRGLADMHVHVGGVRISPAVWRELMDGQRHPGTMRQLAAAYRSADFPATSARRDPASSIPEIDAARACRAEVMRIVEMSATPAPRQPWPENRWWRWSVASLRQERRLLLAAWQKIMKTPAAKRTTQEFRHLDEYLRHKHQFASLVRQPVMDHPWSPPGLRQFERYFQVLKPTESRRRRVRIGTSARWQMLNVGDACIHLAESENLRRIELRMAPFDRCADYWRFFSVWQKLKKDLVEQVSKDRKAIRGAPEPPDIRFAVHFKRTRDKPTAPALPDAARKVTMLDRQSVALRLALSHPDQEKRELMRALGRIDVAGQERDNPASLFGLHLRLLRDDRHALESLKAAARGHPCKHWLDRWLALRGRDDYRPEFAGHRLGLTVHAGEDFADLLDGIYQVGSAIEVLALDAGDGIGHGLALAGSADDDRVLEHTMIQRGSQHDSLCWLYDLIERNDRDNEFFWLRPDLRTMIERSGRDIHAKHTDALLDCDDFRWLLRHMARPTFDDWEQSPGPRKRLVCRSFENHDLMARREEMVPLDRGRRKLAPAVEWARRKVLETVKSRRIVIELNPASNLRVSGARTIDASPTVRLMLEAANGLLTCVNTDDPAVFSSCIENEYALLLEGMIRAGHDSGRCRALLETARAVGVDVVY